jgi:KDO2-lipid IV(A) lauroyltransferase
MSYLLYRTASALVRVVPRRLADFVATQLALLFYLFRGRIRENVRRNFEAMSIENPDVLPVFKNFARSITDFLRYSGRPAEVIQAYCNLFGRERLDEVLARGKGAILFTPHLGPWEVAGACTASLGYRFNTVALDHPSRLVTSFFSSKRRSSGITDYSLGECVGKLIEVLRRGEIVVLLVDRIFSEKGIEVKLFGRPVTLPDGHIILSRRTGAPLVPCWCYYNESGTIDAFIGEPLELPAENGALEEIGSKCIAAVENQIRTHSAQWFAFDHLWPEDNDG